MCKFKSAIILKDSVFCPDYDSHSEMLLELGIEDSQKNAETMFVRAELLPIDGDAFSPIEKWKFNIDQDFRPEWFVEEYEKSRMVDRVKEWAKHRIFIGIEDLVLSDGKSYYLKDCQNVTLKETANVSLLERSQVVTMRDSSNVGTMRDSSNVGTMWDSSNVGTMIDNSQVGKMWDSSWVGTMRGSSWVGTMRDSSSVVTMRDSSNVGTMQDSSQVVTMQERSQVVTMRDSSQVVTMRGSSTAIISEYSSNGVDPSKTIMMDNSTIKDNRTKTIYQSGDWKLISVNAKA
jgi:hypothetical protein